MTDAPIETVIDRIEQWLVELESGKHKQTTDGYLCVGDSYCCLGVAAQFVMDFNRSIYIDNDKGPHYLYEFSNGNTSAGVFMVPSDIGLISYQGAAGNDFENEHGEMVSYRELIELNDSGTTFPEIAAILREDLATNKYGYFIEPVYQEWSKRKGEAA